MKKLVLMAAMIVVPWMGTSNAVQGFSWGAGGCAPSWGGGFGGPGMMMGGFGGYGMMGGFAPQGGGVVLAPAPVTEATLIVTLPADAILTVDGEETTSTSAKRVFITPALEQGKEYEYTLKAKVVRDGETKIATAKVIVRPGQTSQVELEVPTAGVAAQ